MTPFAEGTHLKPLLNGGINVEAASFPDLTLVTFVLSATSPQCNQC